MRKFIAALLRWLFTPRRVNYRQYLRSPEWKARARATKLRAGMRCQHCGVTGNFYTLQAHHVSYARLGHERASDLIALCDKCHERVSK